MKTRDIMQSRQHSVLKRRSIITAIQSVTIQTYFIDVNALRKKQYLLRYSLPHYRTLHSPAFIRRLQSQHPVSTLVIEKVFGLKKTLSTIQKMLVSPADFSTRPVGRALWGESLVLSKVHSSIRAHKWNFRPL